MKTNSSFVSRGDRMLRGMFILALTVFLGAPVIAHPRILFAGNRWDPEFDKVQAAAAAAVQTAVSKEHQLEVTSVFDIFGDAVSPLTSEFQLERLASVAQKRWPKD